MIIELPSKLLHRYELLHQNQMVFYQRYKIVKPCCFVITTSTPLVQKTTLLETQISPYIYRLKVTMIKFEYYLVNTTE